MTQGGLAVVENVQVCWGRVPVPEKSWLVLSEKVCPRIVGTLRYVEVERPNFLSYCWHKDNAFGKQLPRKAIATSLLQSLNVNEVSV